MSLKEALLKAGFQSSKIENERVRKVKKEKTKTEKHQEHRNFCEVCETIQPDVERFKHRNPRIDAEWICANCADKNDILDQFRLTNQSDFARSGRYRRFYGPMKDFSQEGLPQKKERRHAREGHGNQNRHRGNRSGNRDVDGNRRPHNRSGNRPVRDRNFNK